MFKSILSISRFKLDFRTSIQVAAKFYHENSQSEKDVDTFLFHNLDTNDLTVFFYDCIDGSITIRIGSFLQSFVPRLLQAWVKWKLHDIYEVVKSIVAISLRYADLPKDILFLYFLVMRPYSSGAGSVKAWIWSRVNFRKLGMG